MNYNNWSENEFNNLTYHFIHVLRELGFYHNRFFGNDIDENYLGKPEVIINSLERDAPFLDRILNDNSDVKYFIYFDSDGGKTMTFKEILEDRITFFCFLIIRFLNNNHNFNHNNIEHIVSTFLRTEKELRLNYNKEKIL